MAPPRDPDPFADLTIALRNLSASGEATSPEQLRAIVAELRAVARSHLGSERASHTLQPTALVNEAFLKLFGSRSLETIHDRQHFFALASRIMRQILVDHARQRTAGKRGGDAARSTLIDGPDAMTASDEDVLDVNAALIELADLDERQARVVELRLFAGLEKEDGACAMESWLSTAERKWRPARAWLGLRMGAGRSA
jgi:RNA polymerase sigma factor (TIGR02999 family)